MSTKTKAAAVAATRPTTVAKKPEPPKAAPKAPVKKGK